ncbi:MAG: alpha/beta fold hydrolase [Anaerolineaceae bacterium]
MNNEQIYFADPCPNNKRVILLLHGLGSDSTSWQLHMNTLISLGYRPIAVDLPGFGISPYTSARWIIRRVALLIAKQLIDIRSEPIILIGLSLGGVVAQKILQIRPKKIEKVILISTFSRLHPKIKSNLPYLGRRIIQVFSGNIRQQARIVADRLFPLPDQKDWHDYLENQVINANPKIYRQAMMSLAIFNSRPWMKDIYLPCLVVTGDKDSTVTVRDQKRLAKLIRGSQHIIIKGGGHAVNVDHFQEFNHILQEFLGSA